MLKNAVSTAIAKIIQILLCALLAVGVIYIVIDYTSNNYVDAYIEASRDLGRDTVNVSKSQFKVRYVEALEEQQKKEELALQSEDIYLVKLKDLTEYAKTFVGNPYVWGGTDPNTGADCSGFVQYVYKHFGVEIPRVSADQGAAGSIIKDLESAMPGDLIFYDNDKDRPGIDHVVMYLGDGNIVHASNSKSYEEGGGIRLGKVNKNFVTIRRFIEKD